MLAAGVIGVAIERIALRPLRGVGGTAAMITTIGVSYILFNIILLTVGASSQNFPNPLPVVRWEIAGAVLQLREVLIWGITLALMLGLHLFVSRTRLGKAMRATAQDAEAARMMGVDVDRVIVTAFFLGSALAGAAALIFGLYYNFTSFIIGYTAGLRAFTVPEYHTMVEGGILTPADAVELLEGYVVNKMSHNSPHGGSITRINVRILRRLPAGWTVRIQLPITLADSEKQSDVEVPIGAVFDDGHRTGVWILDQSATTVRFAPVQIKRLGEETAARIGFRVLRGQPAANQRQFRSCLPWGHTARPCTCLRRGSVCSVRLPALPPTAPAPTTSCPTA